MTVGSIVFGPKVSPTERRHWDNIINQTGGSIGSSVPHATACNCIGPQPDETKCPCALAREVEMGRKMVDDGVTINGRRYKLVPDEAT